MKRIILIPLLVSCALLSTNLIQAQDINKVTISIELNNVTLREALATIAKLTPFKFTYKTADIAGIRNIRYQQQNVPVKKVLDDLLSNNGLQYEQVQTYILIKKISRKAGQTTTVYGFVTAAPSGEALIGTTVNLSGNKTYTTLTNAYGFYSLTIPAGEYILNGSHIGFLESNERMAIEESHRHNIELRVKEADTMQAVIVSSSGKKSIVQNVVTGNHRLSILEIKRIAMGGGEPDVLKSLQFLPGIQAAAEGTTNLSVRGGSYDQNLILLDEAPVYNPTHSLGFFSAFNTDALKDVAIYKGIFPAQYGGRLSSVVDIRMKEGNSKQYTLTGGIGLVASRLTFEGPVKKGRSSFMISGRYSNTGAVLNRAYKWGIIDAGTSSNKISFYDLNAKFNTVLGNRDRLYLSAYTGYDNFYLFPLDMTTRMNWGNTTVTARWNHIFNTRLFANTSLLYSHYKYTHFMMDGIRDFSWRANLKEVTLKTDFDWSTTRNSLLKLGTGITLQDVWPGKMVPNPAHSTAQSVSLNNRRSAQVFAYINHEQKINKKISISFGIRATGFAALGDARVYRYNADTTAVIDSTFYGKGKIITSYFGAEPKATARFLLSSATSLKIAYGRNYQFQHLLTNSSVGLPTDMWMPSDTYFKPQYADHFSAGVYKTFPGEAWEASMEVYYRKSFNVIDYRDNAELFLNDKVETQVFTGKAMGYGLELLIKKSKGVSNGWISYTWSKASRQINGINNSEWYPASYDRRHNLSLVYNQTLSKRIQLSANWVFRSGNRATLPLGTYAFNGMRFIYYSTRNGYTLPAHHRLDLSVTWHNRFKVKKEWQSEWILSIYNAYNRQNVVAVYVRQDPNNYSYVKTYQISFGGIIPSIAYNFKF
jgi:carboxypeptidase-like protein/TonB-dependent receptor-like protein